MIAIRLLRRARTPLSAARNARAVLVGLTAAFALSGCTEPGIVDPVESEAVAPLPRFASVVAGVGLFAPFLRRTHADARVRPAGFS